MSTEPAAANSPAPLGPLSPFEQLRYAKQIVEIEAQALHGLAARLDTEFCRAVEELYHCPGSVIVTGIGKAGLIGQKLAATLASTGTRSHFIHAGEAVHGDLGRIHRTDTLILLSQSGETRRGHAAPADAQIIRHPDHRHHRQPHQHARSGRARDDRTRRAARKHAPLGLAPSTSTTAMLAMGDALGARDEPDAEFRPRGFCPLPSWRQPGATVGKG